MPINSGVLSFGLVAIPVKLYPAIKDQSVRFHLLHNKCSNRRHGGIVAPGPIRPIARQIGYRIHVVVPSLLGGLGACVPVGSRAW